MSDVPPDPPVPLPATPGFDADIAFLLEYLKTRDVPCPLCQYNLRNLTVPRCPECGREVRLSVGMVEPYMLPWVLTTVFMAMAASIGVLFLAVCMVQGPPPLNQISGREIVPCVGACWGIVAIPLTFVLVLGRRRVFRWERSSQWWLTGIVLAINSLLLMLSLLSIAR